MGTSDPTEAEGEGMNTSRSETVKEPPLKPSRRSLPCLAQSQTHPQSLSKHSSFLQSNQVMPLPQPQPQSQSQPQPVTAEASSATVNVVSERAKVMETLENNLLKLSNTKYCDPFLDIGREKDTYTDDSEHGNYDSRTDESLLIKSTPTRQKPEPRTKSSLKVIAFTIFTLSFPYSDTTIKSISSPPVTTVC
ncbi:anoctamin-3-like [Pituophis catenifer annectens]|uniref:anoctamin-3-like n=1 Tax=Pituophis catenifer annectens TaxID=94852 RepID=UPI003995C506